MKLIVGLLLVAVMGVAGCGGGGGSSAGATNAVPVANAGAAKSVGTGVIVTLDGSGSSDANGDSLSYTWTFASKPTGSGATLSATTIAKPTFTADVAGVYTFNLVVNDGKASSVPATVTINVAPVANAGAAQNVRTGKIVTLDGSGSSSNVGLSFKWSFSSRPNGSNSVLSDSTAIKPTFTPDLDGDYVISLVVTEGTTNSTSSLVTIKSVSDLSKLFSISTSKNGSVTNDYVQAGSTFTANITNVSNDNFALTKCDLINGGSLITSTTNATLLNNNQLSPGQNVGIIFTLSSPTQNLGFVVNYYFTDSITNSSFMVSSPVFSIYSGSGTAYYNN